MKRGLMHRCPHCGEGRLYRAYLKVADACPACGHELGQYRADDGPAYFTILLVGHLVVAPMLAVYFFWKGPIAVILPLTLVLLAVITLSVLPRVKGAFLGLLYSLGMRAEPVPGAELSASDPTAA
jgi:uncharacterized protein (DUF983 family)